MSYYRFVDIEFFSFMKLSVIIPAHNEEEIIGETVAALHKKLTAENILHEIIVINDNSKDSTEKIVEELSKSIPVLIHDSRTSPSNGFGFAIRKELKPFLSEHFNLTLELPLKTIIRGYSYTAIPNSWNGRKTGTSAFRIKEMSSRYFFILRKCFFEKYF